MMRKLNINILNRKVRYEFHLEKTYTAGIKLLGSEIKSIRDLDVNINDAYCFFDGNELFVKNMYIGEYDKAFILNTHEPRRDRKLLLNRSELDKMRKMIDIKGYSIVVSRLFINDKGYAKLEIHIAKGKKLHDKRNTIKERDIERETKRKIIE